MLLLLAPPITCVQVAAYNAMLAAILSRLWLEGGAAGPHLAPFAVSQGVPADKLLEVPPKLRAGAHLLGRSRSISARDKMDRAGFLSPCMCGCLDSN